MAPPLLSGSLELILLAIIAAGPRYGLEIITEANERTNGYFAFKEGSLYPALHRLEKTRLIKGEFAPSDRGGPRRRYYSLTALGRKRLAEKRGEWAEFTRAVESLIGVE